jgi:hypothetical protein
VADAADNEYFKNYFHLRADLAEELHQRGFTVDANIVATTALDALTTVWLHDFPTDRVAMEKDSGGKVPPSIRMARLVRRFAAGASHVDKVAVFMFAEEWKKNVPASVTDADALLAPRRPTLPGEFPHAHLDVSRADLLRECPAIVDQPLLAALAEEYEYPALVYRFVRSPFVHYGTSSGRTHGFTRGEEVFYMPLKHGTTIGIDVSVVTGWLRAAATAYVAHCTTHGVRPATDIESGRRAEEALASRWKRAVAGEVERPGPGRPKRFQSRLFRKPSRRR